MRILSIALLLIFCVSCSSSSDDGPTTSNYSVYIIADIDGQTFESGVDVDATSNFDPYGSSMSFQPIYNEATCVDMIYEPGLYPFGDDTLGSMGIGFVRFLSNAGITCSSELDNFDSLFTEGSYTYAESEANYGVNVHYSPTSDGNSAYYQSYGTQDGSASFQITNVENLECGFSQCVTITGTFSCRLYNQSDASDFIDVTNGTFKLINQSWNP